MVRFILLALVPAGCGTSPKGRKQLLLLPKGQMNQMGVQAFSQMKQSSPPVKDAAVNEYVKCVTNPILKAAEGQSEVKSWEIVVFNDNSPNAFALPGGKIGVHTGMLKIARTDGQLAAVIGHEVGHVIAEHGNERVSQGIAAQVGMTAASLALNKPGPRRDLTLAALGLGTQVGVLLPFSRSHESEADLIGLDLMAKAGFDPRESVELWKNMRAAGGKGPPQFLSTHPANETRIKNLEANIPKVMGAYTNVEQQGKKPHCELPSNRLTTTN